MARKFKIGFVVFCSLFFGTGFARADTFQGPYSKVTLDTLLDTPIIAEEILFEKSGSELLSISSNGSFNTTSKNLITATGFEATFTLSLVPGRYVLGIQAKGVQGQNSYWATVDGNNIGHPEWGFIISQTSFAKSQEPFTVSSGGAHVFRITLRGSPGSQIQRISVYRQSINASILPSALSVAKEQQISANAHPRIFLTPAKLSQLRSEYQNPASKLHQFYRLPPLPNRDGSSTPMGYYQLKDHALAQLLSPDPTRLTRIKEWFLKAIAISPQEVGRDLWAGWYLDGVATAYDWLYEDLEEDLKVAVRARIKQQLEYIANVSLVGRIGLTTYGRADYYQQGHYIMPHYGFSLGAAAIYGDDADPVIEQWLLWGWDRFERTALSFVPGAFQDGATYMDSSREWQYKYIDLYEDFTGQEIPRVSQTQNGQSEFRLHFILPGWQKTVNFDDTPPTRQIPPVWAWLWEAKRYQDPVVMGMALKLAGLPEPTDVPLFGKLRANAALWFDADLEVESFVPEDHLSYYNPEMEIAFTRSGWGSMDTLLGFVSQPYGGHFLADFSDRFGNEILNAPHNHPHQNHFYLYSRGQTLALDPGYTIEKRTRDENTILIDGQGQHNDGITWMSPSPGRSHITRFVKQNDVTIMTGDASTAYPLSLGLQKFERTLVSVGPDLVVAYDELESSAPHVYSWLFHHQGNLVKENGQWKISKGEAKVTLVPQYPVGVVAQASSYTPVYRANDTPAEPIVQLLKYDSPRVASTRFLIPMILSDKNTATPDPQNVSSVATDGFSESLAVRVGGVVVAFNQGQEGDIMRVNLPDGEVLETAKRVVVAQLKNSSSGPQVEVTTDESGDSFGDSPVENDPLDRVDVPKTTDPIKDPAPVDTADSNKTEISPDPKDTEPVDAPAPETEPTVTPTNNEESTETEKPKEPASVDTADSSKTEISPDPKDTEPVDAPAPETETTPEPTDKPQTESVCANGILERGEECDGTQGLPDESGMTYLCSENCELLLVVPDPSVEMPLCGNGVLEAGEQCDENPEQNLKLGFDPKIQSCEDCRVKLLSSDQNIPDADKYEEFGFEKEESFEEDGTEADEGDRTKTEVSRADSLCGDGKLDAGEICDPAQTDVEVEGLTVRFCNYLCQPVTMVFEGDHDHEPAAGEVTTTLSSMPSMEVADPVETITGASSVEPSAGAAQQTEALPQPQPQPWGGFGLAGGGCQLTSTPVTSLIMTGQILNLFFQGVPLLLFVWLRQKKIKQAQTRR